MDNFNIYQILAMILALLVAIVGHEIMHGWTAYKYGDDTAKSLGRLSINPIVHIDLFGTIILPALLYFSLGFPFGWAKPVPIRIDRVINNGGFMAGVWVSMAGIFYNLLLAFIMITILEFYTGINMHILSVVEPSTEVNYPFYIYFISYSFLYNILLAIFNAYPIPPLDGANALSYLGLQLGTTKIYEWNQKVGMYGMLILIAILYIDFLKEIFIVAPAWMVLNMLLN